MAARGVPNIHRSSRIIFAGVAAAICGVIALTAWMIWDARQVTETHAVQTSENLVSALAHDIERNIEIFDLSLLTVIDGLKTPGIEKLPPQIRNRMLFDGAASARDFGPIIILDEQGKARFESRSALPRQTDFSDRDYFQVHRDQRDAGLFVSAPHPARFNPAIASITFSRRINKADGSFGGVVFGSLRLDYFKQLFTEVQLGTNDRVTLYHADGTITVRVPFNEKDIGRNLKDSVIFEQFPRTRAGYVITTARFDGIERLFVYQQLGQLPLVLSVATSTATIFAEWKQKAIFISVTSACFLSVAVLLGMALLRQQRRADRSDARLTEAIESISEGFVIYDENDHLVMCNEAYRKLYPANAASMTPGARFEDIMRTGLAAHQTPAAIGREEEFIAERMRMHRNPVGPHEHQLSDGRWVLTSERCMPSGGIAGLRVDITALKSVQASLRESQALLNLAQRVASTGSVVREFTTNSVQWSDEMYRIFGVTRENFTPGAKTFFELVHPEDRPMLILSNEDSKRGKKPVPEQFRIFRPDGAVRWIYREADIIFDANGKPIARLSTYKDITDQHMAELRQAELENQLRHSQKLEALGNLAGGIAHDLNNTLVPILALPKVALKRLAPENPERRALETIIAAGEHARDLVKQILAFSRKETVDKQRIDLPVLAREALQILRASVPTTIQIVERLDKVAPIQADGNQIKQVVMNLVTNAAQAIGEKFGTITVSIAPVPATTQSARQSEDAGSIRLTIGDTGSGIDAAYLERIFEPFFTTKQVGQGTGLGLAVVHGIVSGHGGRIECHSKVGEGTEFVVTLPAMIDDKAPGQIQPAA